MVDIDWVEDINILQIIVFAPEIDNGAMGAVNGTINVGIS